MPNKDHIDNGSLPVENAGIHRGKSITKSFKSLFSSTNNSSDNLQGTKKDPSLAHIATLNSAAMSAKDSAEIKSQSSNDSLASSLKTSDLHANSTPASPRMKQLSPVLPLGKTLNPSSSASVNNLIDQELNTINKNIINNANSDMNGLGDRSSSRGRNKLKAAQSIKSKDSSPQGSSREPSLSPQRSLKQYRNRGMSVSQTNFVHSPFPSSNSDSSQNIKRSATLVKGMHHGDGKGIVVNNRHMIWESETFKLYRNFTHEHKLSALPLIDVNPNFLKDPEAMKEALEQRNKDAPAFSISTLFKLNKTSQQVKEQNDEKSHLIMQTSKGYIPSKAEIQNNNLFNSNASHCKQVVKIDAYCSMKKKRNIQNPVIGETEANETGTPCIVNTKAAISKDELHLINDLTTRMKTIIDDKEQQPVATIDNKESEFVSKYGYCAGTLGQGSYGVVKVTCRKLKQNPDAETKGNAPYIVDNIAKKSFRFRDSVFFAVKELQADRKNVRKIDSDDEDSMNGSFMDDESSEADSDSKSTTLSDNIRIKLTKHRKRKNKDYNAKFCTRLTSEFVIGHALNNIGRHPNILKIFDLYQYDNISNKFLQVMEFCPSGDLHSLIKRTAVNGNGKTISREIQLPPIGPGPVFVGDTLNLMDGGTSFSLNTLEGQGKNEALPEKPKLSGSQQNLLDSLIVRKQEKHTLLHPLEIDCFMKQIINGVAFMHEHGVAHCDLKPENILIKPNGILKLSDFGTSCVFQTAWEKKPHYQKGCFGSEPYMAPEQFIPHKQYDPRLVDTFAVGIIYVTMALGHYPWKSPVKEKDPDYAEFVDSLKVVIPYNAETKQQEIISGEYEQFEEMTHVNAEMKLLRKKCLYRMLHPNPNKRVLVKDVLNSNWMKRTHCCVIYKANM